MDDKTPILSEKEEAVFVRCASHRARNALLGMVPDAVAHYDPEKMFVKSSTPNKGIYAIPLSKLDDAKKIKGVTKTRKQSGYNRCVSW